MAAIRLGPATTLLCEAVPLSTIPVYSAALEGATGANARAFFCTNSRTLIGGLPVSHSTSLLNRSYRLS
jgi:hypothetical protein